MSSDRTAFREGVFARDGHRCVHCGAEAVDAHHLIERRLWADGGYHLDNGASVCSACHLAAERTTLSVEELRADAGITKGLLPEHFYTDETYTKWGDIIHPDGTRSPGELFHDTSVQKVLNEGHALGLYRRWIKHPRTMHLPWSASMTDDDRILSNLSNLSSGPIVVTEKLDGEQTTMYSDHIHARSVDGAGHPSRNWVKNLWSQIAHEIPVGWRLCGENVYARHSIAYDDLDSWFYVHSMWDARNVALSWDETREWAELLDLEIVPTLYEGPWDETHVKSCWQPSDWDTSEGYVVRSAGSIPLAQFRTRVAKFVRPEHVQTTEHWMAGQPLVVNGRSEPTS